MVQSQKCGYLHREKNQINVSLQFEQSESYHIQWHPKRVDGSHKVITSTIQRTIWLIHVVTSRSTTKSTSLLQHCNNPNMNIGVYSQEPFQGKPTLDLFNSSPPYKLKLYPLRMVKFSRHITSCKVQGWTTIILVEMVRDILAKCMCF